MTSVSRPTFTRVRLKEGYTIGEVDHFLDEVENQLARGHGDAALAERIMGSVFTPVRLRPGYDMGEVDAHLDELVRLAWQGHPRP